MGWLKHAFAVEPPGPVEPTDPQQAALERVCTQIVKRRLTTPALLFLEITRPMNYIGAQALHFAAPFLSALTDAEDHKHLATFLERRGSIDYLYRRIEEMETRASSIDP